MTEHRSTVQKWGQNSIYNYEESLRNDQLPVYDEVVQLVLDGTNPPSYGVDISAAET